MNSSNATIPPPDGPSADAPALDARPSPAEPVPRPANDPKQPAPPPGERWFGRVVDARLVLVGVVVGFIACVGAGRGASTHLPFRDVDRLHQAVGPETNFFPTATQLAAVATDGVRHDKVIVLVGGNSILYGSGQPADGLWSRELQRRLGERYVVRNFAMRGANFAEGGAAVAEVLLARGYRVVYLANTAIASSASPFDGAHTYLFWDAYFKGRLTPDPVRDATIADGLALYGRTPANRDLLVGQRLNAKLFFNDLWTAFAYRRVSTSYAALHAPAFWRPREAFPDAEGPPPDDLGRRYRPEIRERELYLVNEMYKDLMRRDGAGRWVPDESHYRWRVSDAQHPRALPKLLRDRTLMVVVHDSAFYVRRQPGDGPAKYRAAAAETVRRLKLAGYESVEVGADFAESDYADRAHLAPSGGAKMAAALAPVVRDMAARLEYTR